ncbi:protein-glutamine gamma-glutamyltransferase [Bacillus sp. V3-13]|nr:protein-glutamine gamma-glutamyltransferase [Bacillus sp. V3-13]
MRIRSLAYPGPDGYGLKDLQRDIYDEMKNSEDLYVYDTIDQLLFEIKAREQIVRASYSLNRSGVVFSSFKKSRFNPDFWLWTSRGYRLRPGVLPSDAINDIFNNGRIYGFECSTAIVIIFYKALIESINLRAFNYLFANLLVWDWNYDWDLGITTRPGKNFIPGDIVYFYNPDYREPIWMGENAVYLGKGRYYGHGIGVATEAGMINALNTRRRDGAERSAYLLEQHSRLNFKYLQQFAV